MTDSATPTQLLDRCNQLTDSEDYEAVRALYAAVEKSDAQPLALVRQ